MFAKTFEGSPFGTLHGQGRAKAWQGTVQLPAWGPVQLTLKGDANGPLPAQTIAMQDLLTRAHALRSEAAQAICDFLQAHADLPAGLSIQPDTIWPHLELGLAEMSDHSYDDEGVITVFLGLGLRWTEHDCVYLHIQHGQLLDISSGL